MDTIVSSSEQDTAASSKKMIFISCTTHSLLYRSPVNMLTNQLWEHTYTELGFMEFLGFMHGVGAEGNVYMQLKDDIFIE